MERDGFCSVVLPTTDWSYACWATDGFNIPNYSILDYDKFDYVEVDYSQLDYTKLDYTKLDYAKLDMKKANTQDWNIWEYILKKDITKLKNFKNLEGGVFKPAEWYFKAVQIFKNKKSTALYAMTRKIKSKWDNVDEVKNNGLFHWQRTRYMLHCYDWSTDHGKYCPSKEFVSAWRELRGDHPKKNWVQVMGNWSLKSNHYERYIRTGYNWDWSSNNTLLDWARRRHINASFNTHFIFTKYL
jgi:hypothetical protein